MAMNPHDSPQMPPSYDDSSTPCLPGELADLIIVTAIRATTTLNRSMDAPRLIALLNVRDPRHVYPNPIKAALMQMWWIDLDAVSLNPDLPIWLLDMQLSLIPHRPLQYSRWVLERVMRLGRVDVLDWWFAHHYSIDGPLFFEYDPIADLTDSGFLVVGEENGRCGDSAAEAALKWCFRHACGIDLDSVSSPIPFDELPKMQNAVTAVMESLIACGGMQATLDQIAVLLGPEQLAPGGLGWHYACKRRDWGALEWLKRHARIPSEDELEMVPANCFASGDRRFVEWCLELVQQHVVSDIGAGYWLTSASGFGSVEYLEWCFEMVLEAVPQAWKDAEPLCLPLQGAVWQGSSLDILDWLMQNQERLCVEFHNIGQALTRAMERNDVAFLRWCRAKFPSESLAHEQLSYAVRQAARKGHLEALQFCLESEMLDRASTIIKDILNDASQFGHVNVLRWCKTEGLPITPNLSRLMVASAQGHLNVLDWWWDESGLSVSQFAAARNAMGDLQSGWLFSRPGELIRWRRNTTIDDEHKDAILDWWESSGLLPDRKRLFRYRSISWLISHGGEMMCGDLGHEKGPLMLEVQLKAGMRLDLGTIMDNTVRADVLDWCLARARQLKLALTDSPTVIERLVLSDNIACLEWWSSSGLPLRISRQFADGILDKLGHMPASRQWVQKQLDQATFVVV